MNDANDTRSATSRLASLDILRGLDLFLLLFVQPVLWMTARAARQPWLDSVLYHFDHERWVGFRMWDLVMPLFLFMVGTSMPFSFARYRSGGRRRDLYVRIGRRVAVLFLLGMIVQGNLLALDPDHIYIYTNTLQAIAVGYLIAALAMLHTGMRGQALTAAALLIVYWLPMALRGDYSPEGNFAFDVDRVVIGRFRGDLTYTWVWSSLTFGVTVIMGAIAGQMIRSGARTAATAGRLALCGAALVVAGLLWGMEMPVIKRLWTSSMTLLSGGYCFLLMALFYYWIDCRGHSRGLGWLRIYGMNAITAYMLGEVINFRSIAASLTFGLERWMGPEWYAAWLTLCNALILMGILWLLYRNRLFLKI